LFGSLTCPYHFTERSDIDVAVEKLAPDAFFQVMATLSEALERDVDLIELSKCHFAPRIREQGLLWTRKP
jgi:predicted nucleotidyltransferase